MRSDFNLTEFLGAFNLTEEDLDYTNNFEWDRWHEQRLHDHNSSSASSDPSLEVHHGSHTVSHRNILLPRNGCYCDGWVKEWALNYRSYHGYVALMVCGFGSLANLLNVAVLTRKGLRRAPINMILTGLAAADVLVMLEYMPFAVYMYIFLPERQLFPYSGAAFVLFHMHFSQLLHTLSIALTLTLALWRYIVVRYPQCSNVWCTPSHCRKAIMCSFVVSVLACLPSYFVFGILKQTVRENGKMEDLYHVGAHRGDERGLLYRLNFWLISVLIKLLPCLVLTIISCRLIQALYNRAKARRLLLRPPPTTVYLQQPQEFQTDATSNHQNPIGSPNHHQRHRSTGQQDAISRSERRADRTTRMLLAVLLLFLTTEIPQGILGLLSAVLDRCFFLSCYHYLGEIMDILALVNGAVNFVLYCSMSRQFRTTFGALFKPKLTFWSNVTNAETVRDQQQQQLEEQQQMQIQSFDVQTTFV